MINHISNVKAKATQNAHNVAGRVKQHASPQADDQRSANLITSAQVTPHLRRVRDARLCRSIRKGRSFRLYDKRVVHDIARRAMGRGLRHKSMISSSWDISGKCQSPRTVELNGAPMRSIHSTRRGHGSTYTLTMEVKCRKCPACLQQRRNLWAYRAQEEITSSGRTWFATFTLSPMSHFRLKASASKRLTDGGTTFELLSAHEKFSELVCEYSKEMTKYLKRLRKQTGASFRYILVVEQHKSGLPHFHALIHEKSSTRLTHSALTTQWKLGFTQFKLVESTKSAWYVCKYLAKTAASRVRASLGYGSPTERERENHALWPNAVLKMDQCEKQNATPNSNDVMVANNLNPRDNSHGIRRLRKADQSDPRPPVEERAPTDLQAGREAGSLQGAPTPWRTSYEAIIALGTAFGAPHLHTAADGSQTLETVPAKSPRAARIRVCS